VALLLGYGRYVRSTLRGGSPTEIAPDPLHLLRWRASPHSAAIAVQLAAAIGLLVVGASLFVRALEDTANAVHLPALLLSLVVVPFATELPETLNSVLWIRHHDDGLAFGNIAGATAFQACLLGALGIAFTDWSPGHLGIANGLLTLASAGWIVLLLRDGRCRGTRLALTAVPWAAYVAVVLAAGTRLQ